MTLSHYIIYPLRNNDFHIYNMSNLQGDEIVVGNKASLKEAFETSVHVLTGELKTGAQEHFYMETQATLAIPHEDKEMELFGMSCHYNALLDE